MPQEPDTNAETPSKGRSMFKWALLMMLLLTVGPVILALVIPTFAALKMSLRRDEVPSRVEAILHFETAYEATSGEFVPCGSRQAAQREVLTGSKLKGPMTAACWDTIGLPDAVNRRGAFWAEVREGTVRVYGISDLDRDGVHAEFSATPESPKAVMVSEEGAY